MMHRVTLISFVLLAACSAPPAQNTASNTSAASPSDAYVPGLGEFMSSIQTHHAKLWYAGSQGNWALAGYELNEIKETFEDAAHYQPVFKGKPIAKMIGPMTDSAVAGVDDAIRKQDSQAFAESFDRLSAACSACHKQADHAFIRIQRPTAPPLTNQAYAPAK